MEKIRIQDDLYTYVNQETLEQLVIPDDQPATGGFSTLALSVEKLMINEFNEMCDSNNYPNSYLENACKLFKIAKNAQKKEADGIVPALKNVAILNDLKNLKDFSDSYKSLMLKRIPLPFSVSVDTDMKDTSRHLAHVQGPNVILPDASYYKPEMAQQKEMILGIWTNIAKMIIAKTDLSAEEQTKYIENALAFDAIIAPLVKTSEEWSEYVAMYNPMKTSKVASLVKPLNLKAVLKDLFGFVPETIIVSEPRFIKNFATVLNEETFELYKCWAYVTGLISYCSLLTEELRDLGSMYMRTLSGIAANTPLEKFAYQLASNIYSEPVGLYYGEKYFGEEAKKDITEIVYQIIDTYKSRIETNEILCEETKQKAIKTTINIAFTLYIVQICKKYFYDEGGFLFNLRQDVRVMSWAGSGIGIFDALHA